jgi:hypothetical protein
MPTPARALNMVEEEGSPELGPSAAPGRGCRRSSRPRQPGVGEGLGLQAGRIPPHGEAGRGTWCREEEHRERGEGVPGRRSAGQGAAGASQDLAGGSGGGKRRRSCKMGAGARG